MRQPVATAVFAALVLAAACDVPTSLPNWNMTWNFPVTSTTISVNSFLPNGITPAQSGTAFQTTVAPVTITRTLAQDCPQCAPGLSAPKPAFTATATGGPVNLPINVTGATLVADTVFVTMVNRYQFDPINPGGGAAGRWGGKVAPKFLARKEVAEGPAGGNSGAEGPVGVRETTRD